MNILICKSCFSPNTTPTCCTHCGSLFITEGADKNVIDTFAPTCLVHRYEGSDLLEPAAIVKEGKRYHYVATGLLEYARPTKVAKERVFKYDQALLDSVTLLRKERRDYVTAIDTRMAGLWTQLQPLSR
ncbi:MAG: hypothetical protein AAGU32_21235 [Bacillota bacterium]